MYIFHIPVRIVPAATIKGFEFFGAGFIWVDTQRKLFFLRFDMINKWPLQYISEKLLLMAPFYVWKVEIFQCGLYLSAGTIRAGTVILI